jgi:opacity protein-like surface antigen
MRKAIVFVVAALLLSAGPAMAQGKRIEISGLVGWTLSDGVAGDTVTLPNGKKYDYVDLADSFNWGLMFGVMANDNFEIGFMFNQQPSKLRIGGPQQVDELGDININSYHGYFAYNFGDADAKLRPYILGGLGATNYGSVGYTKSDGAAASTNSDTQFSTTWGAGIKYYPSERVGLRFGMRWTPTYITSEASGWWCDPYWGCYVVGDSKYANQFDFSGGVSIRF